MSDNNPHPHQYTEYTNGVAYVPSVVDFDNPANLRQVPTPPVSQEIPSYHNNLIAELCGDLCKDYIEVHELVTQEIGAVDFQKVRERIEHMREVYDQLTNTAIGCRPECTCVLCKKSASIAI